MLTRRRCLQFSALTAAGEAMAAEPSLAQAIRTETVELVAGDVSSKRGHATLTAYEAHPEQPGRFPVVVVMSERWGRHASLRDGARRFGHDNFYAMAPELGQREGGVTHRTEVQESRTMVLHVPASRSSKIGPPRRRRRAGSQRRAPHGSGAPVFAGAAAPPSRMLPMSKSSAPPSRGTVLPGESLRTTPSQ
jgi:hypothetical protein